MMKTVTMISQSYRYLAACLVLVSSVSSCSSLFNQAPTVPPIKRCAPADLGDCTITLTGKKKGSETHSVYKMGYKAPMPKLKVFQYIPQGENAYISFDGVGDSCAAHYNGTMRLVSQIGKTYHFAPESGEMKGFDPENFEAEPMGVTITLNPNE